MALSLILGTTITGIGGGSGPKPLTLGAAGTVWSNTYAPSLKYFNSRKKLIARGEQKNPRIIIANAYLNAGGSGGEVGTGGSGTFSAALELSGTMYQALFSGSTSVVIGNKSYAVSDPIAGLTIPNGSSYFSRIFGNVPSGMPYVGKSYSAGGDAIEYSGTALTDKTMSGTISGPDTANIFSPIGIVSETNYPGAAIFGDSISEAQGDSVNASLNTGLVCRGIGPNVGYMNGSLSSLSLSGFMASDYAIRVAVANAYGSHIIIELAANDIAGGRSLAQMQGDLANMKALFPGKKILLTTATPQTTGTFSSGAGQTKSANESVRLAWNAANRAVPSGYAGYLELADTVETDLNGGTTTVRNGGLWKNSYTGDGLHPNPTGYAAAEAASDSFKAAFGL